MVLHETGHANGLAHSALTSAVMFPSILGVYTGLGADDIAGIQSVYGTRQPDSYDSGAGNNTIATATPLSLATTLSADLTSIADVDYFKFTAPSGATVTASVDARGISLAQTKATVYDGSGAQLGAGYSSIYGDIAQVVVGSLVPGQTYYLAADGATTDVFGMGAYKFTIASGGSPGTDTTSPTASITSYANGALVRSTASIVASATDNVGVDKVEFYIDGTLKNTTNVSPYNYSWNTAGYADGTHILIAKAYDAAGNMGTSANVSVIVDNTAPSAPANLTTSFISNNEIDLSWSSSSDANGIAYYKITRGSFNATTSNNVYLDTGL
ncbi:MAG: Ig-like domain-containing protein, partial [Patescibacteria group bacterium]